MQLKTNGVHGLRQRCQALEGGQNRAVERASMTTERSICVRDVRMSECSNQRALLDHSFTHGGTCRTQHLTGPWRVMESAQRTATAGTNFGKGVSDKSVASLFQFHGAQPRHLLYGFVLIAQGRPMTCRELKRERPAHPPVTPKGMKRKGPEETSEPPPCRRLFRLLYCLYSRSRSINV